MTMRNLLAVGIFDLFHVGHLRYLQYASRQGGRLVVAVVTDQACQEIKGKRPVIPESQRLEIVQGLSCVAQARLQPTSTEHTSAAALWIEQWQIGHVIAGGGWANSARWERLCAALAEKDISVSFAPATDGISTTQLFEQIRASASRQ